MFNRQKHQLTVQLAAENFTGGV